VVARPCGRKGFDRAAFCGPPELSERRPATPTRRLRRGSNKRLPVYQNGSVCPLPLTRMRRPNSRMSASISANTFGSVFTDASVRRCRLPFCFAALLLVLVFLGHGPRGIYSMAMSQTIGVRPNEVPAMTARQRLIVVPLLGANFNLSADFSILNIALPVVGKAAGLNVENLPWVSTAFALPAAGLSLLFGRLGDLYGRHARHGAPEHLLRTKLPATRNLSDPRSRFQCLRDNPGLLIRRPTTPTRQSA
jgi:hypothetical protein